MVNFEGLMAVLITKLGVYAPMKNALRELFNAGEIDELSSGNLVLLMATSSTLGFTL